VQGKFGEAKVTKKMRKRENERKKNLVFCLICTNFAGNYDQVTA
jgi:hypothetical protein